MLPQIPLLERGETRSLPQHTITIVLHYLADSSRGPTNHVTAMRMSKVNWLRSLVSNIHRGSFIGKREASQGWHTRQRLADRSLKTRDRRGSHASTLLLC